MDRPLNILLADDDFILAKLVKKYLTSKGFHVNYCQDGISAIKEFKTAQYDLCLFDVMMPYKDGFRLAQEVRAVDADVPILFISSKTLSEDKIKAFKIGADDYVTKPFDTEELLLRITAILRRRNQMTASAAPDGKEANYTMGKYSLDYTYQKLYFNGKEDRKLTAREADLLQFLYLHRNQLIERNYILKEIWGDDDYYKGRSMDVFVSRLRKYLEQDPSIQIINVHSIGFKFVFD